MIYVWLAVFSLNAQAGGFKDFSLGWSSCDDRVASRHWSNMSDCIVFAASDKNCTRKDAADYCAKALDSGDSLRSRRSVTAEDQKMWADVMLIAGANEQCRAKGTELIELLKWSSPRLQEGAKKLRDNANKILFPEFIATPERWVEIQTQVDADASQKQMVVKEARVAFFERHPDFMPKLHTSCRKKLEPEWHSLNTYLLAQVGRNFEACVQPVAKTQVKNFCSVDWRRADINEVLKGRSKTMKEQLSVALERCTDEATKSYVERLERKGKSYSAAMAACVKPQMYAAMHEEHHDAFCVKEGPWPSEWPKDGALVKEICEKSGVSAAEPVKQPAAASSQARNPAGPRPSATRSKRQVRLIGSGLTAAGALCVGLGVSAETKLASGVFDGSITRKEWEGQRKSANAMYGVGQVLVVGGLSSLVYSVMLDGHSTAAFPAPRTMQLTASPDGTSAAVEVRHVW